MALHFSIIKKVIYSPMNIEIILNVSSPQIATIHISQLSTTIKKNKKVSLIFNAGLNISLTPYV